jgi:CxxC motif-containing protein
MSQHIPFPSIKQFRNVVDHVRRTAQFKGLDAEGNAIMDRTAKAPTLGFIGTVKLHGTNAAVVFTPDGVQFQSRERILTVEQDNAAFFFHMSQKLEELQVIRATIVALAKLDTTKDHTIAVYGEWCGGNIQSNVAINGLPKMFVIFAIKIDGDWYQGELPHNNTVGIYSIEQFPKYFYTIDFENPERAQNFLGELTQKVEASCPVGKHFGQDGIGEGIVWRCVEDPSSEFWFKVKGEKHSASKVKTLASVDVEAITQLKEFVESVVTEARLEQGLQNLINEQLKPFDMTSMGDFIRWVHGDVVKEEADTMVANGIEPKKIGGLLSPICRRWYVEKLNATALA